MRYRDRRRVLIVVDLEEQIEEQIEEPVLPPIEEPIGTSTVLVSEEASFFGPRCNHAHTVQNMFCHCCCLVMCCCYLVAGVDFNLGGLAKFGETVLVRLTPAGGFGGPPGSGSALGSSGWSLARPSGQTPLGLSGPVWLGRPAWLAGVSFSGLFSLVS